MYMQILVILPIDRFHAHLKIALILKTAAHKVKTKPQERGCATSGIIASSDLFCPKYDNFENRFASRKPLPVERS